MRFFVSPSSNSLVLTLSILSVFYGISALQTNRPTLMVPQFSALCGWPHWTDVVHELLVLHEAAATEMAGSSVPLQYIRN